MHVHMDFLNIIIGSISRLDSYEFIGTDQVNIDKFVITQTACAV